MGAEKGQKTNRRTGLGQAPDRKEFIMFGAKKQTETDRQGIVTDLACLTVS
jgi:hypothetical protein